jgi:hypothetical protein
VTYSTLEEYRAANPRQPWEGTFPYGLRTKKEFDAQQADSTASSTTAKPLIPTQITPTQASQFDQFIPDVDPNYGQLTKEQEAFNAELDRFTIFDAYNRFAGPTKGYAKSTDNKQVRCPNPAHPDKHPSSWMVANKDG